MKLPADTIIAPEKVIKYLLVPQLRGDKSRYLRHGGYGLDDADLLLRDLRNQFLHLEAALVDSNQFGEYYEIRGILTGPNGVRLPVRTVWMTERLSGVTKFVTLVPERRGK